MQITHIIPGDLWAGAESQVFYLVRDLIKKPGHHVSVIIFNKGELYNRLSEIGVGLHFIDEGFCNSFAIIKRIREIIRANKPLILHTHEYKCHVLTSIAKLLSGSDCSIVRTLHGKTAVPFNVKMIKTYVIFQLEHYFLKYYTKGIIAVSADIQQKLESKYRKETIFHISNAVSISPEVNINKKSIRSMYGIDYNTFWIGTAARLEDVKNIDMLIDVASILKKNTGHGCKISIFGEGSLKSHLKSRIDNEKLNDVVSLHGHCEDIVPVLQSLDTFVLTSYHEGLPMSLLEAMALGTVTVCTRVGGMTEVINDNENGLLVDVGNADQMAESILELKNDNELMARLSGNAINSMREEYSIDQTVEDLINLYKTVT